MKFEYPNVLYSLFFLAIPIIIHLFNFRKYKTLYFSSLFFIKQINEETKSTQKLKHLLILFSRILAFTCLILAFAQPFLPLENQNKSGSPIVGIYVDNSFSMSLKGTDGDLLSMAKEKARKIVESSSDNSNFIVLTNNFEGVEQRIISKENALDRIDKIDFSPLRKDINQIINWVKEGINEGLKYNKNFNSEQIILLSDFQVNCFKTNNLTADNTSYFYPIQLLPQEAKNLSIDSIWFDDPNFKIGINNELNVKIKNYSESAFSNVELQLEVNKLKRTVFIDLKKNEEQIVKINYTDQQAGMKLGHLQINDKQMLFDDDYYYSYEVKEKSNVLIVDGEDAVSNVAFVYGLDKYYDVNSVAQNSFTQEFVQNKDLIILNGWNQFSSATIELFYSFLNDGGSIAVFPGKNIDVNQYNQFLNKINAPTFGALQNSNSKIKRINYDDPFFNGMFDKQPTQLNLPSQTKIYSIKNKFSNCLSLLELENNSFLFYKTLKPYSAFIFTSSLNDEFGNFKSNALFSSILLRIAETSQRRFPICLTVGSDLNFPIYNDFNSESPIRLKSKDLEFIPQIQKENNMTLISIQKGILQANFKAGLFDVVKENKIGNIALNYDRIESNIKTISENELTEKFNQIGLKNVFFSKFSTNSDASFVKIEKPKEFWRIFLIFAILFLIIEMALLKWLK
jgi:hypothetical protein